MSDAPITEIKTRIRLDELAAEAGVRLTQESNEWKGPCPFHADKDPSFTIYEVDGAQRFKCFGCNASGDIFDFYMRWKGVAMGTALKELADRARVDLQEQPPAAGKRRLDSPIPAPVSLADGELARQEESLARHPEVLTFLTQQRRLTPEVIRRARLGYDAQKSRIVIPMLDKNGAVLRTRLYDWEHRHPGRKMIWGEGKEKPRLYPAWALQEKELLLTAGEMDSLAAWSLGVPAITGTSGEGTWGKAHTQPLAGKRITICYDVDPQGRDGARLVAEQLAKVAAEVRILTLPLEWKQKGDPKDLTDWILASGTAEQLQELIARAIVVPRPAGAEEEASDLQPVLDRLPGAPVDEDAVFPEKWLVSEKGVFEMTSRDGETKFRSIVATPVVITERARNLDTEVETLRIAFLRDGRWRSITAERSEVADKGRLVKLATRGLMVNSNTSSRLVQYLADYEMANLETIPERLVISVSGWRRDPGGDDGFMFVAGKQLLGVEE